MTSTELQTNPTGTSLLKGQPGARVSRRPGSVTARHATAYDDLTGMRVVGRPRVVEPRHEISERTTEGMSNRKPTF